MSVSTSNVAGSGALPKEAPWGNAAVELQGSATVADLVARVRSSTRQEILVDPRLGSREMAVAGDHASARHVLLAVAQALRGTYRAVGSVLLLTDDPLGLGSRASAWARWLKRADSGVAALVAPYRGYTLEARLAFLRWTGYDPIDVTLENMPGRLVVAIDSTAFDSVHNSRPEPGSS